MLAEFIDPAILGFILIGVMLFSIFVGFPISFTLIFLGFVFGYLGFGKLVFYLMTLQFSMVMTEQTLAAVPLFVFMGIMMEQAGLMERLFSAFQLMLAKVRGSLYYAVLFVSVVFAAATGIVGASVTILGIMAAKSMNKSGYNVRLAAGTITAGGTLGILIPPSIMLVVMGPIMEIPVTDLFAAAIIPGILLASLYAGYVTIRCWMDPSLGPVLPPELRATNMMAVWKEFFIGLVPPALLVFAALGSILFGYATPTEAAGCGAMGSLLLAAGHPGKRFSLPNSRIMLHQPSGGFQGQASDIALHAEEILNLKKRLNAIYVKHCKQKLSKVESTLDRDNFMTAEDAQNWGIIDKIVDTRKNIELTEKSKN